MMHIQNDIRETLRRNLGERLQILSAEEVADILRINIQTVRRRLRTGDLPGRKIGKAWKIPVKDLENFLRTDYSEPRTQRTSAFAKYPRPGRTVEDFLRDKHAETEAQEVRHNERHRAK